MFIDAVRVGRRSKWNRASHTIRSRPRTKAVEKTSSVDELKHAELELFDSIKNRTAILAFHA